MEDHAAVAAVYYFRKNNLTHCNLSCKHYVMMMHHRHDVNCEHYETPHSFEIAASPPSIHRRAARRSVHRLQKRTLPFLGREARLSDEIVSSALTVDWIDR